MAEMAELSGSRSDLVPAEVEPPAHQLVEEITDRLADLRERPVSEHAQVYADLQERLQTALAEAARPDGDPVDRADGGPDERG